MRCPVCHFIFADKEDLCPHCLTDVRKQKASLGLPVTDQDVTYGELLELRVEREKPDLAPASKGGRFTLGKLTGLFRRDESAATAETDTASPAESVADSPPPADIPAIAYGELFAGRFYIDALIGQGAVGSVYAAQDSLLGGERVAIKVLHPSLVTDEESLQGFLRELRLARRIESPYVIRMFDAARYNEYVYFTMELVEGESLSKRLSNGPLPTALAVNVLLQLAQGVAAIHAVQIVHRDLKTENVLLSRNDTVKIGDFGVARFGLDAIETKRRLVGSAPYMAPEIWTGQDIGPKADLYALGVIAYELVTGYKPFEGATQAILLLKHLKSVPADPMELNPECPHPLSQLIESLLAKKSDERPRNAAEVVDRLADL